MIKYLRKNPNSSTTSLQFITNTGPDVVLDHLKKLENQEKIIKQRNGKRFIWRLK